MSAHGLLITCQRVPKARAHSHLRFFRAWRVAAPVHDLFFRGPGQGESAVSQPRSKQGAPSPIIDLAQGQRALPAPRSNGCAARRSSARACWVRQSQPVGLDGVLAPCKAQEYDMHLRARSTTTSRLGEAGLLVVLPAPAAGLSEAACKLCARARARAIPPPRGQ